MALIHCPECNREISDKVKACPFCGYPLELDSVGNKDVQKVELSGVNINPKDPAKVKKILKGIGAIAIILIVTLIAYLIVKNNIDKKNFNAYVDNLNSVSTKMMTGAQEAELLLDKTGRVWYNTIWEERDPETDAFTMSGHFFNDDFNTSLALFFGDSTTLSTVSRIEENQMQVQQLMKDLQDPPKGLESCSATLTDLFAAYRSATDFAMNPSGSLNSFSEDKIEKIDKFNEQYQKLKAQIPDKK